MARIIAIPWVALGWDRTLHWACSWHHLPPCMLVVSLNGMVRLQVGLHRGVGLQGGFHVGLREVRVHPIGVLPSWSGEPHAIQAARG